MEKSRMASASLVIVLLCIFCSLPRAAFAQNPVVFSAPDTLEAAAGDTISIPILLDVGGNRVSFLGAAVKMTNNVLAFIDHTAGPIVPAVGFSLMRVTPDSLRMGYFDAGSGPITQSGVLVTLRFFVDSLAAEGDTSVIVFSELSAADPLSNSLPVQGDPGRFMVPFSPADIGGIKWNDFNGNGLRDAGEPGIPGWEIVLIAAGRSDTLKALTDATGTYLFDDVEHGTYSVFETPQAGWEQTFPPSPGFYEITVAPKDVADTLHFGNWQPASIRGNKWHDLNADGERDANEPGLAGFDILLITTTDTAATATDATGAYAFTELPPGSYTVAEVVPAGWVQTFPADSVYRVTLASGEIVENADFGNWSPAGIHGVKWHDLNADGVRDNGEPGLPGWEIRLLSASDTLVATTDSTGAFQFTDLFPGEYVVAEVLQPGWVQSVPADTVYRIAITPGELRQDVDFGNWQPGSIRGMKWEDGDSSGTQNGDEAGFPGWQIWLEGTLAGGVMITDTTTTDSLGRYAFTDLQPGRYRIGEVARSGYRLTFPAGAIYDTVLVSGALIEHLNFANMSTITAVDVPGGVSTPTTFELQQNYPNPFNPSTQIKYGLPKAGHVRLEVYDVLGQRVAVLIDGEKAAGYYDVTFFAPGMPSGLYFYRLSVDGKLLLSRKMLLLR